MSMFQEDAPSVFNPLQMPTPQFPEMKPQGGMFGGGKFGWKQAVAFGLAGFMARRNPALLQGLMGMMAHKQKMQEDQEQYQRERKDHLADWMTQQQFKLDHPDPINNDTVADYNFISQTLGPDAAKRFLKSKTDPMVMTAYGPMPYSSVNGGQQSEIIQSLPPGAQPIGGPSPSGSDGFRY